MSKSIAVFASGTGTNFEAITKACASGLIDASIKILICDNPKAAVVQKAEAFGVRCFVFNPRDYVSKADYESEILKFLDGVDLICLAGYMRLIGPTLLSAFEGKIINIHPSLLPAFKGLNAVEQALEYGVKVFGITIHYVDASLDGGRIIAQKAFEYYGSSADEVHRIGQKIEHQLYIDTISQLLV